MKNDKPFIFKYESFNDVRPKFFQMIILTSCNNIAKTVFGIEYGLYRLLVKVS